MDREILFRGKRIDNGKWVEGGYGEIPAPPVCIGEPGKPTACIVAKDSRYMPDWGLPYKMAMYEVDPSTVGQCTGLPDRDGNRVFEGDIIIIGVYKPDSATGIIRFGGNRPDPSGRNQQEIGFWVEWKGDYAQCLRNDLSYWMPKSRVIGNIHDGKSDQHNGRDGGLTDGEIQ